jgi:hypothetical protein
MTKRITDPDEIAALNAILLTGLEAYLKENDQMFRKSKKKSFSADDFKRRLNDLIDEAEHAHLGTPAILSIMQNVIDNMKYVSLMGARSSYHTTSTISAPPSPSSMATLRDLILGK